MEWAIAMDLGAGKPVRPALGRCSASRTRSCGTFGRGRTGTWRRRSRRCDACKRVTNLKRIFGEMRGAVASLFHHRVQLVSPRLQAT